MKTEASGQTPSNNFIVGRIKRNLLSNSWVGALVTSRDSTQAGDYNRVYGADAHFEFFSRLEIDSYLLRSDTPGLQGGNLARKFGTAWRDDELIVAGAYEAVQSNFNPEVGFIRRRDVSQYTGELAWTPFIESSDSIRNLVFATTLEYFEDGTTDQIETRTQNMNLGIQFLNGASIDFTAGKTFDRLLEPFEIRSGVVIPRGDYSYNRYDFGVSTDSSEKISGGAGIDWGEFWDGDRTSFRGDVRIRPNYHMKFSLEYSRNKIDLPNGRFTTDLVGLRFDYGFTPRAFFNAFVQYNADTNEVNSNLRFHLIHHPLSDLFIVYNDRRDTQRGGLIDRALIVKFTNLFNF